MRRLLPLLCLLALLATVTPVSAAESSATATGPAAPAAGPTATPRLTDVQLWPQDVASGMTIVVLAVLPTQTPLPATIAIPLPQGATVTWAGEIFEQQAQDIQRQPVLAADGRSVTIATQRSRVVQYEAQYKPYADKGGRRYATLEWVQSKASSVTRFAFRLPTSSDDVKSEPPYVGAPDAGGKGDKVYTIGDKKLAVGEKFTLKVDYTAGKVSTLPPVQSEKPDLLLPILLSLLALALAVLAALALRRPQPPADPPASGPLES